MELFKLNKEICFNNGAIDDKAWEPKMNSATDIIISPITSNISNSKLVKILNEPKSNWTSYYMKDGIISKSYCKKQQIRIIKVLLQDPAHYTIAILNPKMKIIEYFDPSGIGYDLNTLSEDDESNESNESNDANEATEANESNESNDEDGNDIKIVIKSK